MNKDINIKNLMKLAAIGKPKRDAYYENTFQQMLDGKKYVWNWSAALFGGWWLVYRKGYGSSFLLTLSSLLVWMTALMMAFLAFVLMKASYNLFVIVSIAIAALVLVVVGGILFQGYFGNRFYLWSLKRKIRKGFHKASLKNRDRLSIVLYFLMSIPFEVLSFPKENAELQNIELDDILWAIVSLCLITLFLFRILFVILNDRRKVRKALKND